MDATKTLFNLIANEVMNVVDQLPEELQEAFDHSPSLADQYHRELDLYCIYILSNTDKTAEAVVKALRALVPLFQTKAFVLTAGRTVPQDMEHILVTQLAGRLGVSRDQAVHIRSLCSLGKQAYFAVPKDAPTETM